MITKSGRVMVRVRWNKKQCEAMLSADTCADPSKWNAETGKAKLNTTHIVNGEHYYAKDINGNIEFPVVGTIHVGGLTRQEIANRVRDILIEENLVKDPYVSCSFANDYFYTLGELGSSIVQIPKDAYSIIEAVAQSGDLTINAERRKIRVIREVNGQLRNYEVDFTSAESVVNSPVYYVQQGDIIYAEMDIKTQYNTTLYGNTVRKPTFWMSLISSILTFSLTIYAFARRFD